MKMPWESAIESATGLISEFIEDPDKKTEAATKLAESLLNNKTIKFVDALVKLAYASEMLMKGLIRPSISAFAFLYGLFNPEVLQSLHELGTIGDAGIAAMFGSFPAWGYSRHVEKKEKAQRNPVTAADFD